MENTHFEWNKIVNDLDVVRLKTTEPVMSSEQQHCAWAWITRGPPVISCLIYVYFERVHVLLCGTFFSPLISSLHCRAGLKQA